MIEPYEPLGSPGDAGTCVNPIVGLCPSIEEALVVVRSGSSASRLKWSPWRLVKFCCMFPETAVCVKCATKKIKHERNDTIAEFNKILFAVLATYMSNSMALHFPVDLGIQCTAYQ